MKISAKLLAIFLSSVICLSLTACGNNNNSQQQGEIDNSDVIQVSLNNKTPVNTDYEGMGAVYHAFATSDDDVLEPYTDEQIEYEMNSIKKTGCTLVRTMFYEGWVWDSKSKKVDWNSEGMKGFYKYLDYMKEMDIEVAVNFGWHIMQITSYDALTAKENFYPALAGSTDWDKCVKAYSEFWSEFIDEVIIKRGYDCIKYGLLFTEPNTGTYADGTKPNTFESFNKWLDVAKSLDANLKNANLRDKIKLVGPNATVDAENWLEWAVEYADDYIDVYAYHSYMRLNSWNDDLYDSEYEKAKTYIGIIQKTGKPFWYDEGSAYIYGATGGSDKDNPNSNYNTMSGTQIINYYIMSMNAGIDKVNLWKIADQKYPYYSLTDSGSFTNGVQRDITLPYLNFTTIPGPKWYAYTMVARYLRYSNQTIYEGQSKAGIHSTLVKNENSDYTLIAVNMNFDDKTVQFNFEEALNDVEMFRKCYDFSKFEASTKQSLIPISGKYENISSSINVDMPAGSIVVCSTIKD